MIPIAEPAVGGRELDRVTTVLEEGQLADGPEVRAFEREFAAFCDVDRAVATCNGTAALHAALVGLDIGAGDRVVTSPFSFIASANAPRFAGSSVGFVDIDPRTYAIDVDKLETRLRNGERIDAVIAVHLFGLPASLDRLVELSETYDFALVEDAAQAHGATFDGRPVGSFGDAGCFSFYPTKNMTTGEGGMVTTDRGDVADRAARFVDHGRTEGYRHAELGHNFRMTSIAASIGRVQLERLPGFVVARRSNARRLTAGLGDTPVEVPVVPSDRTHAYNQYTIRHPKRDRLRKSLGEQDIGTAVYYPEPIHRQPAFEGHHARLPVAERVSAEVVSLPVHPGVTEGMIDRIVDAVGSLVVSP